MYKFLKLILALSIFGQASAQDSVAWNWQVAAQRKDAGIYELHFKTAGNSGWQLYAPASDFDGIPAATLSFPDSSIEIVEALQPVVKGKNTQSPLFDQKEYEVFTGPAEFLATIRIQGEIPASLLGNFAYTYGKEDAFYPLEAWSFSVPLEGGREFRQDLRLAKVDLGKPLEVCGGETAAPQRSLPGIFLLGFLGGLLALLTPCVFPMIPLTVSFFTKRPGETAKGGSRALLYGFFIFLIYVAFSIPFHLIGKVSPTIYNDIATNIYLNLIFFFIFIVFAISFFGFFEITLPGGLANSTHARHGSGVAGIFFMALTLVIVSFSCTGPILGTLLVGTADGGAWPLTAGLAGFGLALGLPFGLFALFPGWLQSLPRSGGWLHTVKVVLGFVELALAVKFLSNADLVAHWGLLKRETFFAIWILISFALFCYLMGWIRFPHDGPVRVRGGRFLAAIAVLAFTIYLLPGVSNTRFANIGLLSGFPPPHCYSLYAQPVNCREPLLDYEEALALAKKEGKPLLIDFTGWACVNCRKMEENVWPKKEVRSLMEEFILVSLYVDDKEVLPAARQFTYTTRDSIEEKIITVGDKWSTFQTENFDASSQPWYVLLTPDEQLITAPVGYMPDANAFAAWLQCGLNGFRKAGRNTPNANP